MRDDGVAPAFVLEDERRVRERELLRAQPPAHLHNEAARREKDGFRMLHAVGQLDAHIECRR